MKILINCLAVGGAGFFGALARYAITPLFGNAFPLGTFIVNVTGSFLLGWFLTYANLRHLPEAVRLGIAVGFIGTYTTFSTFMYDNYRMLGNEMIAKAMLNVFGSLIAGLAAVWLGIYVAGKIG